VVEIPKDDLPPEYMYQHQRDDGRHRCICEDWKKGKKGKDGKLVSEPCTHQAARAGYKIPPI
jgi:hypothetical protein